MSIRLILSAVVLATVASPALAQTAPEPSSVPGSPATTGTPLPDDRGYDKSTPRTRAVDAVEAPVTADLNATSALGSEIIATTAAEDKAQYELDREAYWAALIQHDRSVRRTDARWARQQGAYADAMAAWRLQVAECKRGNRKACDRPTPTPDQFY